MRPGLGNACTVKGHAVAEIGNSRRDYRRANRAQRKRLDYNEVSFRTLRADIARSVADYRFHSVE